MVLFDSIVGFFCTCFFLVICRVVLLPFAMLSCVCFVVVVTGSVIVAFV